MFPGGKLFPQSGMQSSELFRFDAMFAGDLLNVGEALIDRLQPQRIGLEVVDAMAQLRDRFLDLDGRRVEQLGHRVQCAGLRTQFLQQRQSLIERALYGEFVVLAAQIEQLPGGGQ